MPFTPLERPLSHNQKKTDMGNFTYKEQHGVIVICQSEEDQKATYEWPRKNGLNVKVVTV